MYDPLTERAISALRSEAATVMTLTHLYDTLTSDPELHPGSPTRLRECLQRRPDLFLLLDPPTSRWAAGWPDEQLTEYQHALRAAGIETSASVALLHRPTDDGDPAAAAEPDAVCPLRKLDESLVALGVAWTKDPELLAEIAAALVQAGELRSALQNALTEP